MTEKQSIINIARKIALITADLKGVQKSGTNDFHKYDYAQEVDVVQLVRKAMGNHNVACISSLRDSRTVAKGLANDKGNQFITEVVIDYTWVDLDSEESITTSWRGYGADANDKGIYKAITGCNKYALLKTFLIPTGEKDDPEFYQPTLKEINDAINSIAVALAYLDTKKVDGFEVEKRKLNSVEKHLGVDDLMKIKECEYNSLTTYLEHLRDKVRNSKKEN